MTAFLFALVGTLALMPLVLLTARRLRLIDVPNHRSLHADPIPRGGGIGIALASVASVLVFADLTDQMVGLLIGAVVLGILGLIDDRIGLPSLPRLVVQLAIPLVTLVPFVDGGLPRVVVAVVVVVLVAGFVNAFNFMDGINGISGWNAVVGGVALGAMSAHLDADTLAVGGWAVAGAGLGFMPFNAVRARLFLGDVGSYFLGFWLAGLGVLAVDAGGPVLVIVAPFLLYIADTSTVLVRRALRGDSVTEAHREHAYQRLAQLGYSHVAVAAGCAAVSAVCAALMWTVRDASFVAQAAVFVPCLVLVGVYLAAPTVLERRLDDEMVEP
jgi:UDP-N-acetylmuramyl pentapeptide phosphotransferase/UDP-N-acetylglucosamine-1-phosphate transferase